MSKTEIGIIVVILLVIASIIIPKFMDARRGPERIITVKELQQQLVKGGHDIEVDGVVGKATMAAWDKAICNQYGIEAMEAWND